MILASTYSGERPVRVSKARLVKMRSVRSRRQQHQRNDKGATRPQQYAFILLMQAFKSIYFWSFLSQVLCITKVPSCFHLSFNGPESHKELHRAATNYHQCLSRFPSPIHHLYIICHPGITSTYPPVLNVPNPTPLHLKHSGFLTMEGTPIHHQTPLLTDTPLLK